MQARTAHIALRNVFLKFRLFRRRQLPQAKRLFGQWWRRQSPARQDRFATLGPLLSVLLFLAPLASDIPLAALSAILFVVAWNMSEVRHFTHILTRAPTADRVVLVITFLLTVFADLVVAVNVGVILAVLHFMRRMAASVETERLEGGELQAELRQAGYTELPAGVVVYEITGPMFFGAVENLERALLQTHTDPAVLVIRLRRVPFVDMTGIQSLQEAIGQLQRRGVRVLVCEANPRVRAKLVKAGLFETLPAWDCVEDFAQALGQVAPPADGGPRLSVVE